jgi:hypothetical protein
MKISEIEAAIFRINSFDLFYITSLVVMGLKREGKEFYTEHLPQILARLNQLLILVIES